MDCLESLENRSIYISIRELGRFVLERDFDAQGAGIVAREAAPGIEKT